MKNLILNFLLTSIILTTNAQSTKINVNNVSATIIPSSVMFEKPISTALPYFEVLKDSRRSTIFSCSLMMIGLDSTGQLQGLYQTTIDSSTHNSYSTGPLTVVSGSGGGLKKDYGPATITMAEQAKWKKVFCVSRTEIEIFKQWYACSQNPSCNVNALYPGYSIPSSIITWPAHGDVSLLQDFYLAPFFDKNLDGIYNPNDGDFPCIKGDQYCWYVINNRGISSHDSIGIEVHVEAYSYDRDSLNPLNNTIFVGKDIINRSTITLNHFIISQNTDFDIGCSQDDYIGSMPNLNSYFGYNANITDNNCSRGTIPYGNNPPAQGVTFLNQTLNSAIYYTNSTGLTGAPNSIMDVYDYMNGKWKNGPHLQYGGNGYPIPFGTSTSGIDTNFVYPYSDSIKFSSWSEISLSNPTGDRKMISSIAPHTFTPGDKIEMDIAYTFSRSDSGNLKSVDQLYQDIKKVQAFYNDSIKPCSGTLSGTLSIKNKVLSGISLFPNPTDETLTINSKENENLFAEIMSVDGKVIISKFKVNPHEKINITHLVNGIYLIKITNEAGNFIVLRIIKN